MLRRAYTCSVLGLASAAAVATAAADGTAADPTASGAAAFKASIVHVIADDLGYNDIWRFAAATGEVSNNPYTFTPNIERIIGGGIAITAYHTCAIHD